MKRQSGQANVEEHPKGSGRFRVRARVDGKLKTVASGLPETEANGVAAGYTVVRNSKVLKDAVTLVTFGPEFLNRRELEGVRGVRNDRAYWNKHVSKSPLAKLPLATLEKPDVVEWRDGLPRKLAYRTKVKIMNLLRAGLKDAVDHGFLKHNPAEDVKVNAAAAATDTDDLDGILWPDEQRALIAAVDPFHRPTVVFALCTGLRQAEQWWLQWSDIRADRVIVRRSSGGKAPKSGKPREVFLLPPALSAIKASPRVAKFVFPALEGGRREEGKAPRAWRTWLTKAGITRRVRWHDLRHTCATSLLAGWWGRKWSLDEVCRLLGHSSISVTERYARKLDETQQIAVSETPMKQPGVPSVFPELAQEYRKSRSRLSDLNRRPVLYEGQGNAQTERLLNPAGNTPGEHEDADGEAFLQALAEFVGAAPPIIRPPARTTPYVARKRGSVGG
jgi:integrase